MSHAYKAKKGAPLSAAQAKKYGPCLQRIADKGGGELTAGQVLSEAKRKKSPLHDFFEWNETEAARQYNLEQARRMIRSIEIVYVDSRGKESRGRAFPSVAYGDERTGQNRMKHRYLTAQRVIEDEETRAEMINGFRRRLNSLRREMRMVEGLDETCRILDDADEQLGEDA